MGALYRDLVRKHSKAKGSARAVLNILADYASDEGLAWPGRAQIASDTGMSERNVIRCIQTLCEQGCLEITENATGGRGRIPVYKILIPDSQKGDNLSPNTKVKRVTNARIKGDKLSLKGDKSVEIPSHARSEPQEPKEKPKKRAKKPAPPRPPKHVAVIVFHEKYHRWPNDSQQEAIAQVVTDLGLWRCVLDKWHMRDYRPTNIEGQLDWYEHPEKFKTQQGGSNGKHGGHSRTDYQPPPSAEFTQAEWDEWLAKQEPGGI